MQSFAKDAKKNITEKRSSSERANKYLQAFIRKPQCQQLAVEEHLRTCGDRKFDMSSFFMIIQESKSLKKSNR